VLRERGRHVRLAWRSQDAAGVETTTEGIKDEAVE